MNPENTNQAPSAAPSGNQAPIGGASKNTGMAILAYIGILIIVPLLTDAKNDPFVKFHIKQGLVLIISFFLGWMVAIIPILGWIVGFVWTIINVICLISGIINAAGGKEKELPIIGKFGRNFNF